MAIHQLRYLPWLLSLRTRIVILGLVATIASTTGTMLTHAAFASIGNTTYSSMGSGYMVSGRWFHYIKTDIQLPTKALCAQLYKVVHTSTFSVTVELGNSDSSAQLIISDNPTNTGCEKYTAEWVNNGTTTALPVSMSPGNHIKMWVFYDQKSTPINGEHSISGHLLDQTTGDGDVVGDLADNPTYTNAQIIGGFGSSTAPMSQFRAFEFTYSTAETYTGVRGTLIGPWTTHQVVMTSNGQSGGTVEASSPVLWNGGRNFGTWVRAAA